MKILLICSAGMSTSMVMKKMREAAVAKKMDATIWAVGDAEAERNVRTADIILLGPQVRFLLNKIQEMAGEKPVMVMDMMNYGTMNGAKILEDTVKKYKECQKWRG